MGRVMWRRALMVAVLTTLSACASVPLSTMWMMRSFTAEDFFSKDPKDFRVAVRTDDRMKRAPGDPQIDVRIEGLSKKPICYTFALTPVDAKGHLELPLAKLPAQRRWYAYALSKQGVEAFDRARREVRVGKLEGGSFALDVTVGDMDIPDDADSVAFGIDVALDRKEGYFTLIKETSMKIDRTASAAKKKSEPLPRAACEATT